MFLLGLVLQSNGYLNMGRCTRWAVMWTTFTVWLLASWALVYCCPGSLNACCRWDTFNLMPLVPCFWVRASFCSLKILEELGHSCLGAMLRGSGKCCTKGGSKRVGGLIASRCSGLYQQVLQTAHSARISREWCPVHVVLIWQTVIDSRLFGEAVALPFGSFGLWKAALDGPSMSTLLAAWKGSDLTFIGLIKAIAATSQISKPFTIGWCRFYRYLNVLPLQTLDGGSDLPQATQTNL